MSTNRHRVPTRRSLEAQHEDGDASDPLDYLVAHRALPVRVRPMTAETVTSYARRITERNYLRRGLLPALSRRHPFLPILSILTGYTERHLVSALPELRTPSILRAWPHLYGEVSARAGTRPACTMCVRSRLGTDEAVLVFASHEQLICPTHYRWLGTGDITCTRARQFSIASCREISSANLTHRLLVKRWGRGPTRATFIDAVGCLSTWSRWPAVLRAPDIQRRRHLLGITEDTPAVSPEEIAAWYPNAVSLTGLILDQRDQITKARWVTPDVVVHSVKRLQNEVIAGLSPGGAWDPYRRAIVSERLEPDTEVECRPQPPAPGTHARLPPPDATSAPARPQRDNETRDR